MGISVGNFMDPAWGNMQEILPYTVAENVQEIHGHAVSRCVLKM